MDREKVINDLQDAVNDDWMWQHADYYAKAMENAIALLKEQEEVVRCKDCKHGRMINILNYTCTESQNHCEHILHSPDWFCANGRKKDD